MNLCICMCVAEMVLCMKLLMGVFEKENVTISVIPIGTGNDFVKYFEDLKRRLFKSGKLYRSRIYGL